MVLSDAIFIIALVLLLFATEKKSYINIDSGHCCVDIAEKATPILRGEIHYIGSSHPSRLCQNNTEFLQVV
jgi:hypothetical protein